MPWPVAFVALAAIWGASFMFIKVGLEAFAPVHVAAGRIVIGALTLGAVLAVVGERLPRDRALWGRLFVAALLFNTVPFLLFAVGETRVTSVVAGIWNATTPLLTLLVGLTVLRADRPTGAGVAGLVVGFAGVVVVLGPWDAPAAGELLGQLACLGAAACYGLGFHHARRHLSARPESGLVLSAGQLACATAQSVLLVPLAGPPTGVPLDALLSLLALGALGTGLAYVLNFRVLRAAGVTTASTVTYLIPLFSTAFGVALLGEDLAWHQPVGAAVILLGVAVSQGLVRPGRRSPRAGLAQRG